MKRRTALLGVIVLGALTASAVVAIVPGVSPSGKTRSLAPTASERLATASVPKGVTLQPIDGGTNYYARIYPGSGWMDQHILLGGWDEEPLDLTNVKMDVAMGNNIYWTLAASPSDSSCNGPCRADYDVIRVGGMHVSAPDRTSKSGSETVAYEGYDEADMQFGSGTNGWNPKDTTPSDEACVPSGTLCGYTVSNFFLTGQPQSYGSPGYPTGTLPVIQTFGKGVLFWDTDAQARKFLTYTSTLAADSYWMSDRQLSQKSEGACVLLPATSTACETTGLTSAQTALPANYAYNVTHMKQLEAQLHVSKPILVDIETGCPTFTSSCTSPAATQAAAWHALIAGARGIIWFDHNFGGNCFDNHVFYDGSNPQSSNYNCQQTPGVTLHDVVESISAVNHEIEALNSVLLSPFAMNYVAVGSADVSVMSKYSGGTFYVFAASGKPATPPKVNMGVTFHLADAYTGPVTVIDEHRTLHAVNGVFTDTFKNANAVHIYKIG